ncbi:hypothetical protein RND71_009788 [Anisodus tanguticus]|uniref:Uncharacterized protein n=1 Tax=Anisodus tanguticus TaxID=243964 RepID=A0AAE1VHJ2_9SOLA|nr:hypothetical protein RND71_009788 [Anisodus tanguticus]
MCVQPANEDVGTSRQRTPDFVEIPSPAKQQRNRLAVTNTQLTPKIIEES